MYAWVNAEERYSDRPRDSVTRVNGPANQVDSDLLQSTLTSFYLNSIDH